MEDCFYTYVLVDPRTFGPFKYGDYIFDCEPFYVGKGKEDRWRQHFESKNLERCGNKYKVNKIRKIIKLGFLKEEFSFILRNNLNSNDANSMEKLLISSIGRHDLKLGPLTNLTDGGDGGDTWSGSTNKEQRSKRLSESLKGKTLGRIVPKNQREQISESLKTYFKINGYSDELKSKILEKKLKNFYKIISPENEVFIEKNLRQFSQAHGLDPTQMYKVAKGRFYTSLGWKVYVIGKEYLRDEIEEKWKNGDPRANEYSEEKKIKFREKYHVNDYIIISPNNEKFTTNSLRDFCLKNRLNPSIMLKVAQGKIYKYKGWICYILGKEYLRTTIEENIKNNKIISACSPDGIFYCDIENIKNFNRIHNIGYYPMIIKNIRKGKSYKNWFFFYK